MSIPSLITKGALALGAMGLPFAAAHHGGMKPGDMAKHGVFGTVSSISGSTLTVTDKDGKAVSIDASSAHFMNGPGSSSGISLSDIQVGDKIMAIGNVNGSNVSAKSINDQSLLGRVLFGGRVTAVNGSSITINMPQKPATPPVKGEKPTAPTMISYTVDLSGATLSKPGKTATTIAISDIKVGDQVAITGTLNGSAITAKSLSDMGSFKGRGVWKGGMGMHRGFGRGMRMTGQGK